jgi:hypothetical protein
MLILKICIICEYFFVCVELKNLHNLELDWREVFMHNICERIEIGPAAEDSVGNKRE